MVSMSSKNTHSAGRRGVAGTKGSKPHTTSPGCRQRAMEQVTNNADGRKTATRASRRPTLVPETRDPATARAVAALRAPCSPCPEGFVAEAAVKGGLLTGTCCVEEHESTD